MAHFNIGRDNSITLTHLNELKKFLIGDDATMALIDPKLESQNAMMVNQDSQSYKSQRVSLSQDEEEKKKINSISNRHQTEMVKKKRDLKYIDKLQKKENISQSKNDCVEIRFKYSDTKYKGQVNENNRPHGFGTVRQPHDGSIFTGNFENGNIIDPIIIYTSNNKLLNQDNVHFEFANKVIYHGNFVNGQIDGNGTVSQPDGTIFKGIFKNGMRDGFGITIWPDNSSHEGNYEKGMRNGTGKEYRADSSKRYEGNFVNGMRNGTVKEYRADRSIVYDGNFVDDRWNGDGILFEPNGSIKYKGKLENDKPHGHGTLYRTDGSVYVGEFLVGLCHGDGEIKHGAGGTILQRKSEERNILSSKKVKYYLGIERNSNNIIMKNSNPINQMQYFSVPEVNSTDINPHIA